MLRKPTSPGMRFGVNGPGHSQEVAGGCPAKQVFPRIFTSKYQRIRSGQPIATHSRWPQQETRFRGCESGQFQKLRHTGDTFRSTNLALLFDGVPDNIHVENAGVRCSWSEASWTEQSGKRLPTAANEQAGTVGKLWVQMVDADTPWSAVIASWEAGQQDLA